ncbi:uncharacterized protein BDR25DRAFT_393721 [Lindgomyces ingoldianus]|uniref:Uncharacterized protein n=1 Tax=Lindgomyces ingoldianus TaxID=673940 RepID=A0ACB6QVT6_9PLEO|nr:uncharacterized protein BDR25DRAFT_393721 [Lindgomyces ingoldianus]KAF2470620.1 hypothetical protein BDR25DRAFT_393721 [Lindgomyces ingoldianus]
MRERGLRRSSHLKGEDETSASFDTNTTVALCTNSTGRGHLPTGTDDVSRWRNGKPMMGQTPESTNDDTVFHHNRAPPLFCFRKSRIRLIERTAPAEPRGNSIPDEVRQIWYARDTRLRWEVGPFWLQRLEMNDWPGAADKIRLGDLRGSAMAPRHALEALWRKLLQLFQTSEKNDILGHREDMTSGRARKNREVALPAPQPSSPNDYKIAGRSIFSKVEHLLCIANGIRGSVPLRPTTFASCDFVHSLCCPLYASSAAMVHLSASPGTKDTHSDNSRQPLEGRESKITVAGFSAFQARCLGLLQSDRLQANDWSLELVPQPRAPIRAARPTQNHLFQNRAMMDGPIGALQQSRFVSSTFVGFLALSHSSLFTLHLFKFFFIAFCGVNADILSVHILSLHIIGLFLLQQLLGCWLPPI